MLSQILLALGANLTHQQHLDAARWILSIGRTECHLRVRTRKTLADPALWYRANAVVGRNLVIFSAIFACLTLLMHFTIARSHLVLSVDLLAAVLLAGIGAIAIHGIRIRQE
jgi:hypothetical protein